VLSCSCKRRHVELANGRIRIEKVVHGKRAVRITRSTGTVFTVRDVRRLVSWHRHKCPRDLRKGDPRERQLVGIGWGKDGYAVRRVTRGTKMGKFVLMEGKKGTRDKLRAK
jgi:hypothetical protein